MPPEPRILAFDTSAAHCAAALLCGDRIAAARSEEMGRGQAERLMPLLEELLAEAGLGWSDLSAIAVGTGPGNFTGIRIAVAAARGLALALGVPAIGISRLEASAFDAPRPVCVLAAAPRGMVYAQTFRDTVETAPRLTTEAEAEDEAARAGIAVKRHLAPAALAEATARLAAARLGQDMPRPAPLYIRPADAAPAADPPPVILP